jgi:acetyltransferase-like isoleucine patch superfamily enzyme
MRRKRIESAHPVVIGNTVWIGGGAIVLPGVTIGENSVIGAGSVVTHDIPANVVAVGNPCQVLREISADES